MKIGFAKQNISPSVGVELGGYAEDQQFTGMNGGSKVTTGFAHQAVLSVADVVIDAVKAEVNGYG